MKFFRKHVFAVCLIFVLCVASILALPRKSHALSWQQVSTVGLGNANNITSLNLISFNNKLYASIGNYTTPGVRIFSSTDGATWTQANTSGFGSVTNLEAVMAEYNSALYAGTDTLGAGPVQLWKTTNGSNWTQVGQNGFGDVGNVRIVAMKEFNNNLYIGVTNGLGAEVWRLDESGALTQVNTNGFDGTITVNTIFSLQEYNGALYAGAGTDAAGAQVWKTTNGTTWTAVMQGGFGDINNGLISTLFSFKGELYAGTINVVTGTEIWRTTTGDTTWEQVNTNGFGDALTIWPGIQTAIINGTIYLGTRNDTNGARLFTSTNGSTWTQEGTSGFGDPANNYAIYAITFNGRIYLGISSNSGAEIWRSATMGVLAITTTSLPDATVDSAYLETIELENGTSPFTYSLTGSLPDGLSLDYSTGEISGTPTRDGTFTFTVSVLDSGNPQQMASRELSIKINALATPTPVVLPETGAEG
jgi:hypothetical protein